MTDREPTTVTDETLGFIKAMVGNMTFAEPENIVDFLEKPWHWQTEYDLWVAHGQPMYFGDPGYEEFNSEVAMG
jgi:hypothetical protein